MEMVRCISISALLVLGGFAAASPPGEKPKENVPAGQERPEADPEPRPMGPGGAGNKGGSFVAKEEGGAAAAPLPPLTKEEQVRYDRVAAALVTAINAEDRKAYRALHTDEGWESAIDWWRDMFAAQCAKFGPMVKAYPCTRGTLRFGKMGFRGDGTSFVVIFEEKVGAALTFELNADDKITRTSVFIKEELRSYEAGDVKPIYEKK